MDLNMIFFASLVFRSVLPFVRIVRSWFIRSSRFQVVCSQAFAGDELLAALNEWAQAGVEDHREMLVQLYNCSELALKLCDLGNFGDDGIRVVGADGQAIHVNVIRINALRVKVHCRAAFFRLAQKDTAWWIRKEQTAYVQPGQLLDFLTPS